MSAEPLFTIGHSNHHISKFLELLRQHKIDVLVDVRSKPQSGRNPQYNKEPLKESLAQEGIKYLFLGKELGARRSEKEAYEGAVASYERIATLPAFREGLDRVVQGTESYRIALMCAEKEPLDCHRTLLVCRHLRNALAHRILHILANGTVEAHEDTECRLIEGVGLSADQHEMFSGTDEAPLDRAYRKRGLAVAYREEPRDEH